MQTTKVLDTTAMPVRFRTRLYSINQLASHQQLLTKLQDTNSPLQLSQLFLSSCAASPPSLLPSSKAIRNTTGSA
jgi:hypothetical protein